MRRHDRIPTLIVLVLAVSASCRFGYEEVGATKKDSGPTPGNGGTGTGEGGDANGGTDPVGGTGGGSSGTGGAAGGSSGGASTGGSSGSSSGGSSGKSTGGAAGASGKGGSTGGVGGTSSTGGGAGASTGGSAGASTGGGAGASTGGAGGSAGSGGCSQTNGGVELCDGVDNDCAGGVDDGVTCPATCRGITFDGNGYMFCDAEIARATADMACTTLGMHLVKVTSSAENDFIASNMFGANLAYVWLGGDDIATEASWHWKDATLFWTGTSSGSAPGGVYTNWYPGYPGPGGTADCLEMREDRTWDDKQCTQGKRYVCELLY